MYLLPLQIRYILCFALWSLWSLFCFLNFLIFSLTDKIVTQNFVEDVEGIFTFVFLLVFVFADFVEGVFCQDG